MATGHLQRGLLVHRHDRGPTALVHAGIVAHGASDHVDLPLQVAGPLIVLVDHAGPAARGAVEFDQLEVEQRRDLGHRSVQLGSETTADATGPIGNLHADSLSLIASASATGSAGAGLSGTCGVSSFSPAS